MRYLLDTNTISDALFRRRGVHERIDRMRALGHDIGTSITVIGELYAGAEYSMTREANLLILERALKFFRVWPFDYAAAMKYGEIHARLRKLGKPIQSNDIQIAATALALGKCKVVTTDSDFERLEELEIENWVVT